MGLNDHTRCRQHTLYDSSGRVISPMHRALPDSIQHSQLTSMPVVGFEPIIQACEWPQTHALDRVATG
jgi:hypothetical protein